MMKRCLVILLLALALPASAEPLTLEAVQRAQVERAVEILKAPPSAFRRGAPPVGGRPAGRSVAWTGRVVDTYPGGFVLEVDGRRTLVESPAEGPFDPVVAGADVEVEGTLKDESGVVLAHRREVPRPAAPAPGAAPALSSLSGWVFDYNPAVGAAAAGRYAAWIVEVSARHGVDPRLLTALVAAESAFQERAVSPAGAQGLGQLMPGTAAGLGVSDPFDPRQNLDGAARYLAAQLRRWGGSVDLALASYNAGPGAVEQYGGVPPYAETIDYVAYVGGLYRELQAMPDGALAKSRVPPAW